ncbi:MAG: gluconate 2-dehydrogenase subunit 3 family protein, partial [Ktedonobacterales bacterium]
MATTQQAAPSTTATASWLAPAELRTLEAFCDALLPSLQPPEGEDDSSGFYARSASQLGIARLMAETLAGESPETRAGLKKLLGTLNNPLMCMLLFGQPRGLAQMTPAAREAALRKMSTHARAEVRQGFQAVKRLACALFYSAPIADGVNPNWPALGYTPAPPPPAPEAAPKRIRTVAVTGDLTLTADAVIVGSG